LKIGSTRITVPDEWRAQLKRGRVFKLELTLHVDGAMQPFRDGEPDGEAFWRARWLEVVRLHD